MFPPLVPHTLSLALAPALLAMAWLQGQSSVNGQPAGPANQAGAPAPVCGATSLQDTAGTGCITASSTPTVGALLPLGPKFHVTPTGRVGLGTLNPAWPLHVVANQAVGRFESTSASNGSVIELRNQTAAPGFLGAINFVNSSGATTGQIGYEGDDELTFRVGGSEQGRIGIGVMKLPGLRVLSGPSCPNMVSGYSSNLALAGVSGGTIGGGGGFSGLNVVLDDFCTVGGGYSNAAGYGLDPNVSNQLGAAVLGGRFNAASGFASCIVGGEANVANGTESFVGGGDGNRASGAQSSVVGGLSNLASGWQSSVLNGSGNVAAGQYSIASGVWAEANHDGCFVFNSNTPPVSTSAPHQFVVRASGGVWLGWDTGASSTINIPGGVFIQTSTGAYLSTGGTWVNASDRDRKVDVEPLDPRAVLEKVVVLPVHSWSYRDEDPSVRHAGPMAQDFHAAFGLGGDERAIATIDADGVALAAIQGLNALVEEQAARIAALETRLAELDGSITASATALR